VEAAAGGVEAAVVEAALPRRGAQKFRLEVLALPRWGHG